MATVEKTTVQSVEMSTIDLMICSRKSLKGLITLETRAEDLVNMKILAS